MPDGTYQINGVTGPDEENPDVNNDAYTNVSAKTTLQVGLEAARVLGRSVPSDWTRIASGIVVPAAGVLGAIPEFNGYDGQLVKQADVTLLEYPWAYPEPATVEQSNLNYYAPRTDPNGPSMTDSVNSIDSAALGTPGCSSWVFTRRSVEPFLRDSFDQFSETRTGGAFTFMTGIGGFLQEFLYGYSGLRWNAAAVQLAPSLTGQLRGIVLHGLGWHGRRFTVAIGSHTSSEPGTPALAAVDGSPSTSWQPSTLPSTLTAPVPGGPHRVSVATLQWGQQWPPPPSPTQPPPPGPVSTLRATSYTLAVSSDGHTWRPVASVQGRTTGTTDVLRFPPTTARYLALRITAGTGPPTPVLDELAVS
jgi:hypothetical protein